MEGQCISPVPVTLLVFTVSMRPLGNRVKCSTLVSRFLPSLGGKAREEHKREEH